MVVGVEVITIGHPVVHRENDDQVIEEAAMAIPATVGVNVPHGARLWNGDQSVMDGGDRLHMVGSHQWRAKGKRRIRKYRNRGKIC